MCLGAQARTANANARRQYQAANNQRESNWMQSLAVYNAKINQYEQDLDNTQVAIGNQYADAQRKKNEIRQEAELRYEGLYANLLKDSKYSQLLASGRTGRSIARQGVLDAASYGRDVTKITRKILLTDREADREASKAVGALIGRRDQQYAGVAFQPIPDVEPPQPVMQSVGAAMFMDALSIGTKVITGLGPTGFDVLG